MSKYNSYAKRVDAAFKKARTEHGALLAELDKAFTAVSVASSAWDKEKANFRHREAEKALKDGSRDIWQNFNDECAIIGRELAEASHSSDISPDAIDPNGMEILKAGICTADDMAQLAERYSDNATMLRMVSKYAHEAYEHTADMAARAAFLSVMERTQSGKTGIVRSFEELVSMANTLSGTAHGYAEPGYVKTMQSQWETMSEPIVSNF